MIREIIGKRRGNITFEQIALLFLALLVILFVFLTAPQWGRKMLEWLKIFKKPW